MLMGRFCLGHRGRPLGRVSRGTKSLSFPIISYRALVLTAGKRVSQKRYSSLSFRRLISEADRRAIACAEAIRSVTHLLRPQSLFCIFIDLRA
jgi:hypothetical protein